LDSVPAKADANPPMSTSMIIGLTLAVALPPAILIGAIIGFLVHRSFF
jgi:F0F1-type ATP synthase assembly protein I